MELRTARKVLWVVVSFIIVVILSANPSSLYSADSKKLILLSFDGGMNDLLHEYLDDFPKGRGFSRILKEGIIAKDGMEVSLPSLTATSHVSIITGVEPARHGIVSNNFHIATDPISQATNGFSAKIDSSVKTLWEKVRAQGKKVGVISYPALDNTDERRSADWSVNFSKTRGASSIREFKQTHFTPYTEPFPKGVKSYSTPKVTTLILSPQDEKTINPPVFDHISPRTRRTVQHVFTVIAIDSQNDDQQNYDSLLIDNDSNLKNGYLGLVNETHAWIALSFRSSDALMGSWGKLLSLSPSLTSVQFYVGSISKTVAFPKSFQKLIDEKLGFWPGPPDRKYVNAGFTKEDILTQAIRFSEYLKELTLLGAQTQEWDLLISYQPILDELEHQFLMKDPKQKDYSQQKSESFMKIIREGYLQANKVVDELMTQFKTNLVIISDHGMAPLHRIYYPNRVLALRGYIESSGLTDPDSEQKKYFARAFSSGGLSHVYINLIGRNPNGIVAPGKYEQMRQELIKVFEDEEAIAKVYTREATSELGLNHPNSGDIILVAKPGYHLTDLLNTGASLELATFYGQHGYHPSLPSMKALYAAWGPNIKPKKVTSISYKEIFPLALELLN